MRCSHGWSRSIRRDCSCDTLQCDGVQLRHQRLQLVVGERCGGWIRTRSLHWRLNRYWQGQRPRIQPVGNKYTEKDRIDPLRREIIPVNQIGKLW